MLLILPSKYLLFSNVYLMKKQKQLNAPLLLDWLFFRDSTLYLSWRFEIHKSGYFKTIKESDEIKIIYNVFCLLLLVILFINNIFHFSRGRFHFLILVEIQILTQLFFHWSFFSNSIYITTDLDEENTVLVFYFFSFSTCILRLLPSFVEEQSVNLL